MTLPVLAAQRTALEYARSSPSYSVVRTQKNGDRPHHEEMSLHSGSGADVAKQRKQVMCWKASLHRGNIDKRGLVVPSVKFPFHCLILINLRR